MATPDPREVARLCDALGIQALTARILISRGLSDPDEAYTYLNPSLDKLSDPMQMCGMEEALHRTLQAFHERDPILVFGDYDVDGVTASSTVYQYLKRLGVEVQYMIPLRSNDGYGLNADRIHEIKAQGTRLLITTDCGISCHEEIVLARQLGMDTIVIDHHSIPHQIPPAVAILNPLLPTCSFPFKRLAAVGVAFNYIRALHQRLCELGAFPNGKPDLEEYMDIAALGTVADAVPLLGDNRILVRMGLEVLRRRRRPGVNALMERARLDGRPMTTRTIGYRLAPLLNAAGRIGHAGRCVELLTTDSYRQAEKLAKELERDNNQRQRFERQILQEAEAMAEQEFAKGRNLLMLSQEHWHPGVLGIVASRIKETFHRPAALVAISPETGKARVSLRSIEGIDLVAALHTVGEHLESYGGHTAAAGMTLHREKLELVRERLDAAIGAQVAQMPSPLLKLDADCALSELNEPFLAELRQMAPFGAGNPEPVLVTRQMRCARRRILSNRHLRVQLREGDKTYEAIGFALANQQELLRRDFDAAFTPRRARFRGKQQLEIQLRDLRPSGHQDHEPFGICEGPCWNEPDEDEGEENVS